MNKQEVIRRMKREQFQVPYGPGIFVHAVFADKAIELISQIDEPQKVVVPKFVAEWIEIHKESFSDTSAIDMYDNLTLDNSNGYYHDVWLWVIANHYDFIKAWHVGYEVEKEQMYTVVIPNPNIDNILATVLKRTEDNTIELCVFSQPDFSMEKFQLTEAEIKQDFEWAWNAGFAKEVE
ncbi:DUF1642 domain-containing protein [Streptococcus suis]